MRYRLSAVVARWCTERTAWGAAVFAVIVAATVACSGGSSEEAGLAHQPTMDRRRDSNAAAPGSAKSACPPTGAWQLCTVVERLDRAGLAPREQAGRVTEPPLAVPGVLILLGKSELRIFLYADHEARARDQAKLDPANYIAASQPASMRSEATVIVSENLLALLRSRSDHQRERVSDALTAGPPQRQGTKG